MGAKTGFVGYLRKNRNDLWVIFGKNKTIRVLLSENSIVGEKTQFVGHLREKQNDLLSNRCGALGHCLALLSYGRGRLGHFSALLSNGRGEPDPICGPFAGKNNLFVVYSRSA